MFSNFSVLTILLLVIPVSFAQISPCHVGWIEHANSCYKVVKEAFSWPEAASFCRELKSHLVEIGDKAENDFLERSLGATYGFGSGPFWLGGLDVSREGHFEWADSQQLFNFTDWEDGQPDNYNNEDCAAITGFDTDPTPHFKWNDWPCTEKQFSICESGQAITEPVIIG